MGFNVSSATVVRFLENESRHKSFVYCYPVSFPGFILGQVSPTEDDNVVVFVVVVVFISALQSCHDSDPFQGHEAEHNHSSRGSH